MKQSNEGRARYHDGRDEMNLADFPISALQRQQKADGEGHKLDRMEFAASRYDAATRQRVAQRAALIGEGVFPPEIAEVYSVAGDYDLVAILRVKEYEAIADLVPGRLQRLEGVERTQTLMAFQCYSRPDLERLFSIGYEEEEAAEEA